MAHSGNTGKQDGIYHALDKARQQVRFMSLRYGHVNGIDCQLAVYSLHDKAQLPEYKALSYCWTKEQPSYEIRLNGKPFFIRPNLFEFLKILYEEQQSCLIFIDALCINQEDSTEQSSQVALMGHVYRHAREVVAWMGVRWANFARSKKYSRDISMVPLLDSAVRHIERNEIYEHSEESVDAIFNGPQAGDWVVPIMYAFLQRSFWSRVWIVQEITLARVLTLQFRRLRMQAELAREYLFKFLTKPDPGVYFDTVHIQYDFLSSGESDYEYSTILLFNHFMSQRRALQSKDESKQHLTLMSALRTTLGQECSRSYDNIFGSLGLTQSQLIPDYAMPLIELYLRVLIEGLLEDDLVEKGDTNEFHDGEPTWSGYWSSLVRSLDMSPWDPVVALTSRLTLIYCGKLSKDDAYWKLVDQSFSKEKRFGADRMVYYVYYVGCWLLSKATAWRLRRHVARNSSISGPNDESGKTTSEWMKAVLEIFVDVFNQMRRTERFDAATERRFLGQTLRLQHIEAKDLAWN